MNRILLAVMAMAIVTYIPRSLPLVAMRGRLKSRFLRSFLYYTPYAVLGAMTFPAILTSTGSIYSSVAGMTVAILLAYFEKGLMKVAISAILVVYAIELILRF